MVASHIGVPDVQPKPEQFTMDYGTVVSASPLTITLGGGSAAVPATALSSYDPVVGDFVVVSSRGPDRVVLGTVETAESPAEDYFEFTALSGTANSTTYTELTSCRHSTALPDGWNEMTVVTDWILQFAVPSSSSAYAQSRLLTGTSVGTLASVGATEDTATNPSVNPRGSASTMQLVQSLRETGITADRFYSCEFRQIYTATTITASAFKAYHVKWRTA